MTGSAPETSRDRESIVLDDDRIELRLWIRLLTCSTMIERDMRRMLRDQFETTLPRFDTLAQLDRAPDGVTMGELSERLMVSNGNLTGLVDRLVQEGLIHRATSPTDRRTHRVTLTPEGHKTFDGMARSHLKWIDSVFGGMSKDDKRRLYDLLGRLKGSMRGKPSAETQ
ncbi:MAG: MarR family transcriptional regulator [Alphaproteobacteria bacterium]|nr:MarR family transcriptional regulator [Alphaproteobacteria bacterium]